MSRHPKALLPRNRAHARSSRLKVAALVCTFSAALVGSIPTELGNPNLSALDATPLPFEISVSLPTGRTTARPSASRTAQPWIFFHPAWDEHFAVSIGATGQAPPPTDEDLNYLLRDPHRRLDEELRVSDRLRGRVLFWVEVYTMFNSHMRVIHDRDNPGIIYGYIDFTQLQRNERPSLTLERKMRKVEREIKLELKRRIAEAMRHAGSGTLSSSEREHIRAYLASRGIHNERQWKAHERHLRSQSGQADMFQLALYRSQELLPQMEAVFRRHGLPAGLAHIPFVESSFNGRAYSKAGARGIWQFTPRAAREFLGRRNRRHWADPLLQTEGAARMLSRNHSVLPDWGTTVISFNSGVGRVTRIMHRSGARRAEELMSNRKGTRRGLGFAGQNYYAEFLAANFIDAYKTEIFSPGLFDDSLAARNLAQAREDETLATCQSGIQITDRSAP